MNPTWQRAIAAIITATLAVAAVCQRPGDLVITPTRVLLEDKAKSSDITLVNRGSQPVRYRLTLVDMVMDRDGALHRVPTTENSAANILRLSPREILLEPGASQRIKIAAYFPNGSSDQELRSHLAFEPILGARTQNPADQNFRLNFELRSVVTIPVIAQHGKLSASARISDASVSHDQSGWLTQFRLSRAGDRTIRGDVNVTFVPAGGGARVPIGHVAALPVYFPNADRIIAVRLSRDVRSLGKGEIEISFCEERSRGAAIAKTAFDVPQ